MKKKDIIKYGFTFYISFGGWSKPKIQILSATRALRICLGFIAIKIGFYDIEQWVTLVLTAFINTDDKLKELKK